MVASTHPVMAVGEFPAAAPRTKTSLGVAAGLSVLLITGLWFAGSGSLLRLAIPAMATLFALVLYSPVSDFVRAVFALGVVSRTAGETDCGLALRMGGSQPYLAVSAAGVRRRRPGLSAERRQSMERCSARVCFLRNGNSVWLSVGMLLHPSAETVFGF